MDQHPKTVLYVVSNELANISSLLPSNKNRSRLVHSLASSLRLFHASSTPSRGKIQALAPVRATRQQLALYHSRDYLDYVLGPAKNIQSVASVVKPSEFGLEDDCPPFRGLTDYVELVGGASLTAVKALRDDVADLAICWDGGRHHAQKSHAAGYCYVADCVLAILALKKSLPPAVGSSTAQKPRVMYLDLDLHFSDGVSHAFQGGNGSSPQVLTLSIHHAAPGFFPVSSLSQLPNPSSPDFDPFAISLPLQKGASDATFAKIWPIVEKVHETFDPDFCVVQCGLDGLAGDPCATWNWSIGSGEGSIGWCVDRIAKCWKGKKLFLGGGGYNSPNAARGWTFLTSVIAGEPFPLDTEIPDHQAFPLYAPSFTLDVPPGNQQDQNTEAYLASLDACFAEVFPLLESACNSYSMVDKDGDVRMET